MLFTSSLPEVCPECIAVQNVGAGLSQIHEMSTRGDIALGRDLFEFLRRIGIA